MTFPSLSLKAGSHHLQRLLEFRWHLQELLFWWPNGLDDFMDAGRVTGGTENTHGWDMAPCPAVPRPMPAPTASKGSLWTDSLLCRPPGQRPIQIENHNGSRLFKYLKEHSAPEIEDIRTSQKTKSRASVSSQYSSDICRDTSKPTCLCTIYVQRSSSLSKTFNPQDEHGLLVEVADVCRTRPTCGPEVRWHLWNPIQAIWVFDRYM